MKIKRFAVERIPIEVKYVRPVVGRLYLLLNFARMIRIAKIQLMISDKLFEKAFYRLYIPKIINKGDTG